jgi:hypothetical protein
MTAQAAPRNPREAGQWAGEDTRKTKHPAPPVRLVPDTGRALTSPAATPPQRMLALSESWHEEPGIHLPEAVRSELAQGLPAALELARRDLEPGDPAEVLASLAALASRRGFEMPAGLALDLDVELMAEWPRDLFVKAFRGVWETFAYRRMPEVADFRAHIETDLADRRSRVAKLEEIRLRLETIRLREQWDSDCRKRRSPQRVDAGND